LGDHFRNLFRKALQKQAPEALAQLPARIWNQEWVVDNEAVGSGEQALGYLARYIFKAATANRQLQQLPSGKVLWPYRDSNTRQRKSIALEPAELIRRFLQHVLPKGFSRVRLFGWLHPAAKVRGNRVRALLDQSPILSEQERESWRTEHVFPAQFESEEPHTDAVPDSAPLCPCCGRVMALIGSFGSQCKSRGPTRGARHEHRQSRQCVHQPQGIQIAGGLLIHDGVQEDVG
jgi:hypothetical protein